MNEDNDSGEEENAGTALYGFHQTKQYFAPPVINGRIPKNIYGNLDIYVPSMVPEGGSHSIHPDTSRAARLLGVDYADAVTGFSFRGRHGTAIINGAVVAESCRDAIDEVIGAFEIERQEEEDEKRMLEALRMWKKFLLGLRIRERIQGYEIEGERNIEDEAMGDGQGSADDDEGGGFIPDREITGHSRTVSLSNAEKTPDKSDDDGGDGGFLRDDELDDDGGGGFLRDDELDHEDDGGGGGFLRDDKLDDDDGGGGFLRDDELDDEDDATTSKPGISVYQERQGKFGYENLDDSPIAGVDQNEQQRGQIQSPVQSANRTKLPVSTDSDARRQEASSPAFQAKKLPPPIKQHSQTRQKSSRTVQTSKTHTSSSQKKSSNAISADPLSQATQPLDPNVPSSPSNPYLPDAEMAEALALQQIHDSQHQKKPPEPLPWNHMESNLQTSHPLSTSSSRQPKSASSSPTHNTTLAVPPPPTTTAQVLSSPAPNQENVEETKNARPEAPSSSSSFSLRQGGENQQTENTKKSTADDNDDNDDESESAGSLLSRDPSDEEADPSWLDY